MSRTVQDVLKESQQQFIEDVIPVVPNAKDFIPVVPDNELLDALEMSLFLFPDDRTSYHLDQLLELKGCTITDEQKEGLIPIIEAYVKKLRKIKSLIA
jgi:hypothetical protein